MTFLQQIFEALIAMLTWGPIVAMVFGTILGIVLSALPGISTTLAIALTIPFTYAMDPLAALGLLAGIHNGASQGGAIPAILLRIPGTPGAICTSWDGYPLAQQGKAGGAINLAAVSSAVGGVLSAIVLILLAPPLATIALSFGPSEIFWVNMFGIAAIAALLGDDMLKGILAACFGLLISTVGLDGVTGAERFTFGSIYMLNGIPELAVMLGMFSLPPAWALAAKAYRKGPVQMFEIISQRIWKLSEVWLVWLKSSVIGIIIGILPGSAISAFIAYNEAKRSSKTPERFGKGSIEGLAAAESVNNADNAAAMIPTLTLGVPGSGVAALMLGALTILGFQPGPQLFRENPTIVYGYSWGMLLTSLLLIPLGGALASRIFAPVLRIPAIVLLPLIVVIAVAGSFAVQNTMFPVYLTIIFGIVGFGMKVFGFPIAPVIIGVVLGGAAENSLRVSLLISQGNYGILFHGVINWVLITLTLVVLTYPLVSHFRRSRRPAASAG